jgi:DNA (cytosine-5)-methyltransferase 1
VLPSLLQRQHPNALACWVLIDAMDPRPPRTSISVCSGVGGLDLGLARACGVEPVVYIERDAFAASVLVARMEEKALASAPIWDDLDTFDPRPWRGLVDLVAGGTPCQDISRAGRRAGLDGERSRLFFRHVELAESIGAPLLWWENVGNAVGLVPLVAEYLQAHGYTRAVWTIVRATDVGWPMLRERVFVLACRGRLPMVWPSGEGWERQGDGRGLVGRPADTAETSSVFHLRPPARDESERWRSILASTPHLAPALPEPEACREIDGLADELDVTFRVDRLRACGNGVHPGQATLAWHLLWGALIR